MRVSFILIRILECGTHLSIPRRRQRSFYGGQRIRLFHAIIIFDVHVSARDVRDCCLIGSRVTSPVNIDFLTHSYFRFLLRCQLLVLGGSYRGSTWLKHQTLKMFHDQMCIHVCPCKVFAYAHKQSCTCLYMRLRFLFWYAYSNTERTNCISGCCCVVVVSC